MLKKFLLTFIIFFIIPVHGYCATDKYLQEYKQGNLYFKSQDYEKALDKYKSSIKLNKKFTPAYFNLARCYFYLNDLDQSAKYLKKTLSLNKKYPGAFFRLGLIYDKQGKLDLALNSYLTSISFDKEARDYANLRIGVIYMNKTLFATALKYLKKAYSMNTKEAVFPFQLAVCHFRLGMINKAIALYKSALDHKDSPPEVNYDLGFAYREIYKYKQAKVYFNEYLSLTKNDPEKSQFRDVVNTALKQIQENKVPQGKYLSFSKPIDKNTNLSFSYPDEFSAYKIKKISEVENINFTSLLTSENIDIDIIPNPDKTDIKTLYSRYLNLKLEKNIWQKKKIKIENISSTIIKKQKTLIFDIIYKNKRKDGSLYYTYFTTYVFPLAYPNYNMLIECEIPTRIKHKGFVEKILTSMRVDG